MKGYLILLLLLVLSSNLVVAESIGEDYKVNESMQITNYCSLGNCDYVNLISIEYPNGSILELNSSMTGYDQSFNYTFTPDLIGTYSFVSCGQSSVYVCDKDTFKVTYNGETGSIGAHIILLLFFFSLFLGFYYLQKKTDFEKRYNQIVKKYEATNFFNVISSSISYFFLKNAFATYYLIGLLVLYTVMDILKSYNVVSLVGIIGIVFNLYLIGLVGMALFLLAKLQEFVMSLYEAIQREAWGLDYA